MISKPLPLNRAQGLALARDRNVSLIAGAGTGKTEVLSRRFLSIVEAYRDQDWTAAQVSSPPGGLVAMTYTRKAAGEMRGRIARDIGRRIGAARADADPAAYAYWMRMRRHLKDARITTIHGLSADIVLDHALLLDIDPDSAVLEELDQRVLAEEAIEETLRDPPEGLREPLARLLATSPGSEVRKALTALMTDRSFGQAWSKAMHELDTEGLIGRLRRAAAPCTPDEARVRLAYVCDLVRPVVTSAAQPEGETAQAFVAFCRGLLACEHADDETVLDAYCGLLQRFQGGKGAVYAEGSAHRLVGAQKEWASTGNPKTGSDLFKTLRAEILEDANGFRGLPGEADRELFRLMRPLAVARDEAERRYTEKKRRRRALDYGDLEHLALHVLQSGPGVLDEVRHRIRHLMVDEFQDTNETQWSLIRLLASDDPLPPTDRPAWAEERERAPEAPLGEDSGFVSAAELFGVDGPGPDPDPDTAPWESPHADLGIPTLHPTLDTTSDLTETPAGDTGSVELADDRLFIVGDAKQSIYAFRGADVTVYQGSRTALKRANERNETHHRPLFGPDGAPDDARHRDELLGEIELDENFRSLPDLVHFTNALFQQVLAPLHGPERKPYEAAPGDLRPRRARLANGHAGTVGILAVPDKPERYATTARPDRDRLVRLSRKAAHYLQLAQHIARQLDAEDPLQVFDDRGKTERPAQPSDIAILLPSRTHLKTLERALVQTGIPYVVTGGRGFWERPEVWDHVNLISFLADTHRDVALAALLRSAFFAWIDDAVLALALDETGNSLWQKLQHAATEGEWAAPIGFDGAPPQTVHTVLKRALDAAGTTPTHRILRRIHDATAYPAALSHDERPVQARANVEKLLSLVRERETRQGIHLPRLVRDLTRRLDEEVDEAEAAVPDEVPGVRILTVHAAKGLEYPIVYLPDLDRPFPPDTLGKARGYGKGRLEGIPLVTTRVRTPEGEVVAPVVHRLLGEAAKATTRAEQARLLYVAVTRARDHLFLAVSTPHLLSERPEKAHPPARSDAACWRDWIEEALGLDGSAYLDAYDRPGHQTRHRFGTSSFTLECTPPRLEDTTTTHTTPTATVPSLPGFPTRQDLRPPYILNPSAVETYRVCPAKFRYRHIEALPDLLSRSVDLSQPDRGRLLGSAVHRVLESTRDDGTIPANLMARLRDTAREHGFEPEGFLHDVVQHVDRARRAFPSARPPLKELAFDHIWADGVRSRGVIDRLTRDDDGWILYDTKSDRPGKDALAYARDAGYDAQLAVYREVIEHHGSAKGARLVFTSTGDSVEVPRDPTVADVRERLTATRRLAPDDERAWASLWPPLPTKRTACDTCGFRRGYGGPCAGAASSGDAKPL